MQFYLGQGEAARRSASCCSSRWTRRTGPLEVGLTFGPNGAITKAMVTTATVETKPWVQEAVATGLMDTSSACAPGDDPRKALGSVQGKLGGMPEYMAELIATAVGRGMVLYGTLYKGSAS